MKKRKWTIAISLGAIVFAGALSTILLFSLKKTEKNKNTSLLEQNKGDVDFNYIKEDFDFIKKNHGIEPIFPKLTNAYLNKYLLSNNALKTIVNFTSKKSEKYLEKYSKIILNKYNEKSLRGKFKDKIYEDKYFVSRLRFDHELDIFGRDYNIIFEFKEFFNEARNIDWMLWSLTQKRNTKQDQEHYMKHVNVWRYKNEADILKKIYG